MRYTLHILIVCLVVCALICEAGTPKKQKKQKQTRTRVQKKLPNRSSGSKCTKCDGGGQVSQGGLTIEVTSEYCLIKFYLNKFNEYLIHFFTLLLKNAMIERQQCFAWKSTSFFHKVCLLFTGFL